MTDMERLRVHVISRDEAMKNHLLKFPTRHDRIYRVLNMTQASYAVAAAIVDEMFK